MKIVFFGSDDFATYHLKALCEAQYDVVACVTPPDRPKGRGMQMIVNPVKELAVDQNISVLQPENVKNNEIVDELRALGADLFVVIAYGRLLPQKVLDIPQYGAINVHGSLLPKYRGAAPINWAIMNGETKTGVSIIQMNAKMDAGDVLAKSEIGIVPEDTSVSVRRKLMEAGAPTLCETIDMIKGGQVQPIVQDESQVSFAPKLTKDLGRIDWNDSAVNIHNKIRGLLPWPSAYTIYDDKQLKILSAQVSEKTSNEKPGRIVFDEDGLFVVTGQGMISLQNVHLANSKPMDVQSFLRGHRIAKDHQFE